MSRQAWREKNHALGLGSTAWDALASIAQDFEVQAPRPHVRGRRVRVGWVHDTPTSYGGGAEHSNAQVVKVGRRFGFEIDEFDAVTLGSRSLGDYDVLIVNSIANLGPSAVADLAELLLEDRVPFVRYEHDYGFCNARNLIPCGGDLDRCSRWCSENARLRDLHRAIFHAARLNVLISPLQLEVHERALGAIPRVHLLTPPVDPEVFRPVEGVERVEGRAVCAAGKLPAHKGLYNVVAWLDANPGYHLDAYVRRPGARANGETEAVLGAHPRVTVKDLVPLEWLPRVYSEAEVALFLPSAPEPSGRTPVEAALCGCRVVVNENVGCATFGLPFDSPEALRELIARGPVDFWKRVEEVV